MSRRIAVCCNPKSQGAVRPPLAERGVLVGSTQHPHPHAWPCIQTVPKREGYGEGMYLLELDGPWNKGSPFTGARCAAWLSTD